MIRVLAAAAICVLAAACTTPQTNFLRQNPDRVASAGRVAEPVFFAQRTKECGPAALAMVLVPTGLQVTPDELVDEVYNPGREGSLAPAVLTAARRHGRVAYPVASLQTLFREVAAGRPVLVLQNLSFQWIPQWHYAVVIGYDLAQGTVTLHSGKTRFLEMSMATFERTWERGGYWGLVVLRPDDIPEDAEESLYVSAVAGVERAGKVKEAAIAYDKAVKRWPDNLAAAMGLGNALYSTGDRRGAASAFRMATQRHPESADAHNNLAHVLAETGALDEAEKAAHKAIALGGANVAAYRATLDSILARPRTGL